MRNPARVLLPPFVLALLAAPAAATIVLRATVEDLADKATVIVKGEVVESKARWTEDRTSIRTRVRIRVESVLKGSAGKEVTVTCFGGRVGKEEVRVSGVPAFAPGERVLVFLWRDRRGDLLPLGLNQGKFRIERDAKTGRETARNSLEGLSFATLGRGRPGAGSPAKPDVLELAELERRVRERLAGPPEKEAEKGKPARDATKPAEERVRDGDGQRPPGERKEAGRKEAPPAGKEPPAPGGTKKKPGEETPPGRR